VKVFAILIIAALVIALAWWLDRRADRAIDRLHDDRWW